MLQLIVHARAYFSGRQRLRITSGAQIVLGSSAVWYMRVFGSV
jgi:hypothetical protein